ncbi:uncharacterized protein Nmag_3276 [Natrialba magadii ATCC 43099]|uniref:Alpha-L-glutamate ligase-related protein ATP-grasp domain-containing protein n=1 Tax=Natrialba magadii (strain ATCC 43099 / DSM 3394 / CCM 3739 / CIP 104546 / IAM 13178 / JCM 8861 / NBRC 102185 / NCIMB 2190 / MS3) TaxID=547559 RepID=D3SSI1_NATMM|nr:sugar-transfer associated ATP-grasp domain-containing protein [Natrialba magadii]ADD06826.1 uncharacterized protein Nmag_3276 [Natrialba magadii ATCC 43099]ELY28247.1 hypothetical protein C500_13856 [Natrialba magadii ATCC 43099]
MNVRTLYHTARGIQGLAGTEYDSDVSPSLRRRLWLWRRGFLSRSDAIYDIDDHRVQDYITDYQRYVRTKRINGTWSVALSNKLLFHRVMQPFDDERMTVYGMVNDGSFHAVDTDSARLSPDGGVQSTSSVDTAQTDTPHTTNAAQRVVEQLECDDDGKLVLKWVRGGGGNNVYLCSRTDDGYRVNGEYYADAEFRSLVSNLSEYLVCEHVEQGSFPADLYPKTPNTLRLITMYDEETHEPFIAAGIHRIGTTDSEPLDNFTQGGLSAEIDLETGELGPGARPPNAGSESDSDSVSRQDAVSWHTTHPDTGAQIKGERIPNWEAIRSRVLEMATSASFLPYIGWDVIVTDDDGSFSVIEANSYPGLKSIQVHGPLLADDRVRRFYEHHGVC